MLGVNQSKFRQGFSARWMISTALNLLPWVVEDRHIRGALGLGDGLAGCYHMRRCVVTVHNVWLCYDITTPRFSQPVNDSVTGHCRPQYCLVGRCNLFYEDMTSYIRLNL